MSRLASAAARQRFDFIDRLLVDALRLEYPVLGPLVIKTRSRLLGRLMRLEMRIIQSENHGDPDKIEIWARGRRIARGLIPNSLSLP
jgi:hypothetical protein